VSWCHSDYLTVSGQPHAAKQSQLSFCRHGESDGDLVRATHRENMRKTFRGPIPAPVTCARSAFRSNPKVYSAREANWTSPRRDMQGCGGRRRIAAMGVLMLFSNTVSSASRWFWKSQVAGRTLRTHFCDRDQTKPLKRPSLSDLPEMAEI
jgi:hypothetical protein